MPLGLAGVAPGIVGPPLSHAKNVRVVRAKHAGPNSAGRRRSPTTADRAPLRDRPPPAMQVSRWRATSTRRRSGLPAAVRSRAAELELPKMRHDPHGDLRRQLVLQLEDVRQLTFESVGPDHATGLGLGQLGDEPQAVSDAAWCRRAHSERRGSRRHCAARKAIAKRRRREAGSHVQVGEAREVARSGRRQRDRPGSVPRVGAEVAEGKHGDRGPVADAATAVGRAAGQRTGRPHAKRPDRPLEALQRRSPRSSMATPSPSVSWSRTAADTTISSGPPRSRNRAARLTPSP